MKFYRINVSGVKYFLSKDNLQFDAPNIFTDRFEQFPKSNRMAVDRNPLIFATIQMYLQGYNIFPIDNAKFKEHLLQDASYYGLKGLEEALMGESTNSIPPPEQEFNLEEWMSQEWNKIYQKFDPDFDLVEGDLSVRSHPKLD